MRSIRTKVLVLVCASLIPFGAHYLKHSLGPLKPYLVAEDMDAAAPGSFSHVQFGAFLSAVSVPTLLLPCVSGLVVDEKGPEFSGVLFTTVALFGHLMFCLFVSPSMLQFYPALLGRLIYGFGEGGTGIVQGAILGEWFDDSALAFSVGFTESIHFLANWLGKALPALIAANAGVVYSLLFGGLFLFISVVVAIVYSLLSIDDRPFAFKLERTKRAPSSRMRAKSKSLMREIREEEEIERGENGSGEGSHHSAAVTWEGAVLLSQNPDSDYGSILRTTGEHSLSMSYYVDVQWERVRSLPFAFWLVGVLHLLFSNLHNLFGGFAADFIYETVGISPSSAGLIASLDSFLPIFMAPLIGAFVDVSGKRLLLCGLSALACVMSFSIFLQPRLDETKAVAGMILLSLCNSATPTLVKSAVPAVVSRGSLGTAFAVYSMFESLGGLVGHVLFGWLRESSSSYFVDISVLLFLSLVGIALSVYATWRAPELNHATGGGE